MNDETSGQRYLNVIISSRGIAELDGTTLSLFVPRADIQTIELRSGSGAARPVVQLSVGAGFLILGLASLSWHIAQSKRGLYLRLSMLILLLAGSWMVAEVLRKRTFLLVKTPSDVRKVVFKGRVDRGVLRDFTYRVRCDYGYHIDSFLHEPPN